ncbi:unnamed protein product [Microthlaspi erraticum]|uniref:Uncharacterized protein n=1 Tax=Microthlaspi erraticum TaxID=1685480 RepID=A0A6D2K0G5_9BRAS|nr:unnamed protein product [Microthlaspi erraticum]
MTTTTKSSSEEVDIQRRNEPWYGLYKGCLPSWPSETAFKDRKMFYMMERSELRDNYWVYLYLELAVFCSNRFSDERSLYKLEIVQVAIETIEDVDASDARLNTKTAIVYIKYRDWARARTRDS